MSDPLNGSVTLPEVAREKPNDSCPFALEIAAFAHVSPQELKKNAKVWGERSKPLIYMAFPRRNRLSRPCGEIHSREGSAKRLSPIVSTAQSTEISTGHGQPCAFYKRPM